MNGNAPTLDDVARAAGVSAATISRCINSPDRVAESTRRRVQDAIDQLGYTPNFGGRALATRRTNIVGAVIPSMANAIFAEGAAMLADALKAKGGVPTEDHGGHGSFHDHHDRFDDDGADGPLTPEGDGEQPNLAHDDRH